ncbi:MAG: hypothetical protein E5Y10_24285 [Mesorhizobium sp.]|nr:MAG: hypothetical protein EOS13_04740 [Mesorhizobium sp.]TIN24472.1 MAG: hypothetical protein E5Y19_22260 [Mesorhizobium sp.]TIN38770.1 MAG: hypothetical protein E5Y13_15045 [Mesorhizobium sp.]TJU85550.1 MAG: hypothetical protein E5Y10_24285 [Mesorhizobium sp.]
MLRVAASPFSPSLYGRRCRQADEGQRQPEAIALKQHIFVRRHATMMITDSKPNSPISRKSAT